MQKESKRFDELGTEIIAISTDSIEASMQLADQFHIDFKLLSDKSGEVAKQYGVYNLLDDGVATPSVFVIDKNKEIKWKYIGKNIHDRPSINTIFSKID